MILAEVYREPGPLHVGIPNPSCCAIHLSAVPTLKSPSSIAPSQFNPHSPSSHIQLIDEMPAAAYEIRAGGDVKNKKQSMADLKLRRLNELNSRLKEDLERPRIKVSEASMSSV